MIGLWIASYRYSRDLFFAIGFSAATFSVVSNTVVVIGTIMAERLLYLPTLGFCLALAVALRGLAGLLPTSDRARSGVAAALIAALVMVHGARVVQRNADWASPATLWLADLETSPRSAQVQSNAGIALLGPGAVHSAAPYRGRIFALVALGRREDAAVRYEELLGTGHPRDAGIEEVIRTGQLPDLSVAR